MELPRGFAQENKGPEIIAATVSMTAVALGFVIGRIGGRYLSIRKLDIGDYIVMLSVVRVPNPRRFPFEGHFWQPQTNRWEGSIHPFNFTDSACH